MGLNDFIFKKNENLNIKEKKTWEPFKICLLNSTANPAWFGWKSAGLAVLFSRQILNSSQDFFPLNTLIFIYFFKYETIETHAHAFLTLIIRVMWLILWLKNPNHMVTTPNSSKSAFCQQFFSCLTRNKLVYVSDQIF